MSFPFFDDTVVAADDNHVDLYRRVVDPEHPGLYFVGLIQPLGAIMPLAEAQAEWVGDLVAGEGALPSSDEMRAQIAGYDEQLCARYVASKRHTIQVDFHKYQRRDRARARGVAGPGQRDGAGAGTRGAGRGTGLAARRG